MSHPRGIPNTLKDFYLELKTGHIPGYAIVHKFGRSTSIANNVWSLVSSAATSGAFLSVPSTVRIKAGGDAADTFNGAGAREITIVGIDDTLNEVTETITTSGALASADTTAVFWRVYRAYVSSAGTYGGNNEADIDIENSSDMISILAGAGQTQHAAYSIPADKRGYILSVHVSVDSTKPADLRIFTRENFNDVVAPFSAKRIQHSWDGITGEVGHDPKSPDIELAALTDIWIEARGGGQSK